MKVNINPKIHESLGLTENEARVFAALTSYIMPNSVQRISERCALSRSTTSDILKRFEKRNLAKRVQNGKRYWWQFKRGLDLVDKHKQAILPILGEVK
jgi:DNA-binding MarR family transcriptional regulator